MNPGLSLIDYLIVATYLGFAITVGFALRKRASASTSDYFIGGRQMPWWLVGTSIVATTFASDTPLAITEMTRSFGLWRNWYWWNISIYHVLIVFLFARLWRRAEVITENELLEMRYEGRSAAVLRGFKASYFAIVYNLLIMGWVIRAIATVISTLMGVHEGIAIVACISVALLYATLSGFYGVVLTDLVQFAIAIAGSVYLAVVSVRDLGGMSAVSERVLELQGKNFLDFFPPLPEALVWEADFVGLILFLSIMWWAHPSSDGGGYVIQRISACRDERHAVLAMLYSSVLTVVRAWPWVIVALASIVLFPDLSDNASGDTAAYPLVMSVYLAPGLRGLLLTSFLAAFMSTVDTHLNWGASYITIDLYKRFLRPDADERHYVRFSKASAVCLMAGAGLVSLTIESISGAWEFAFLMGSGIGLVLILRWFWWRINAVSEIAALGSSVLLAFLNLLLVAFNPDFVLLGFTIVEMPWHIKALLIVPATIVCWVVATFCSRPVSVATLSRFYQRVTPGGFWGPVPDQLKRTGREVLTRWFLLDWAAGLSLVLGLNFAVGTYIFGARGYSFGCVLAAALGVVWLIGRRALPLKPRQ